MYKFKLSSRNDITVFWKNGKIKIYEGAMLPNFNCIGICKYLDRLNKLGKIKRVDFGSGAIYRERNKLIK